MSTRVRQSRNTHTGNKAIEETLIDAAATFMRNLDSEESSS